MLEAADRITQAIDNSRRVTLPGNVNPRTKSGVDQGPVDPSMELPYVTLVLKPSAGQQADLDQLLAQQQDPSSPNYHAWLTPEQYGEQFGVSQADIDKIVA
jgi:subtilase family serine protease